MIHRIDSWIRSLLFFGVRLYQRTLSPVLPPSCRFEPSCSQYALEVLQTWPLGRGVWLILKRLARCQPFCRSGFDPVPSYPGHSGHRILSGRRLFGVARVLARRETDPGEFRPPPTGRSAPGQGRCSHG